MWFVNWAIVCASSVKDVPCKDMCGHLAPPQTFPPRLWVSTLGNPGPLRKAGERGGAGTKIFPTSTTSISPRGGVCASKGFALF